MMTQVQTPEKRSAIDFVGKVLNLPLPASWHNVPVQNTKSGKRLGRGWTSVLEEALSSNNKECCWVFKRNYVTVDNSRKIDYPYWQGSAVCKMESCPVHVTMAVMHPTDNGVNVRYLRNPKHAGKELQSRRITGAARASLAKKFASNPSLKPSKLYTSKLGKIDGTQFASGNRTGVGTTNAVRIISCRARKAQHTVAGLESRIATVRRDIRAKDMDDTKKIGRDKSRVFYGYIQEACVNEERIRIVMLEEDIVRLYHKIANCCLFYVDATGGLVQKIRDAKRVLYYAMVIGHPFSNPLPIVEMITNKHSTEAIRKLFQALRERELSIYKRSGNAVPLGIMTDFSMAIITAAIREYNAESYRQYLDRTFRVMKGQARQEDLGKLYVFLCIAHMMKNVKIHAVADKGDPNIKAIQHLVMRFFGRLIHCNDLDESTLLVKAAFVLFKSETVIEEVTMAVKQIEEAINTFAHDIDDYIDATDKDSEEKEECTADNIFSNEDEEEMLQARKSGIKKHWETALCDLTKDLESHQKSSNAPENMYYSPEFMDYLVKYLLPSISLWSQILSGDFRKFNEDYSKFTLERSHSTTGHVERHFGLLKQQKIKYSLDDLS